MSWTAPSNKAAARSPVHRDAVHRLDRADAGDGDRQPAGHLDHRDRADQRHQLHVHGDGDQRHRHRPGLVAVQRRDPECADCAGRPDRGDGDRRQRVGDGELDGAANNGGSTITKYTVTPFIGTTAQTPVTVTGNPPATSTTVTGLTNGTTYTFTVSATNATGTGPASSPSNAVTPSRAADRDERDAGSGATGVSVSVAPTATFSQAVVPNTVSFTLQDSGGNPVAGSVSFNAGNTVATFTPTNSLASAPPTPRRCRGRRTARHADEPARSPGASPPPGPSARAASGRTGRRPAAVDASDTSAVNLGLQFQASSSGYVTGVRFYKDSDNTGSHIGSLWSSTGTLLASGTFSGESASRLAGAGLLHARWRSPPNTTYVVSYHTDAGHYALTAERAGLGGDQRAADRAGQRRRLRLRLGERLPVQQLQRRPTTGSTWCTRKRREARRRR